MQLGLLGSDGDAKGRQCCELSLPVPVGLYLLRISVGRWYSWSPGKEPTTLSLYHHYHGRPWRSGTVDIKGSSCPRLSAGGGTPRDTGRQQGYPTWLPLC